MTWMPTTTPNWVIICWKAPTTPRSRSSTALAMLGHQRRGRHAEADARQGERAGDDEVGRAGADAWTADHRGDTKAPADGGEALPGPDGQVAGMSGPAMAKASGRAIISHRLGLAVAEHRLRGTAA
jgi:hypothetical protein